MNGLKCLFVFSYRHVGYICDLPDEESVTWEQEGFWNKYVQEHGEPIADDRDGWTPHEEKRYQQWKKSMEEQFARPASEVE